MSLIPNFNEVWVPQRNPRGSMYFAELLGEYEGRRRYWMVIIMVRFPPDNWAVWVQKEG